MTQITKKEQVPDKVPKQTKDRLTRSQHHNAFNGINKPASRRLPIPPQKKNTKQEDNRQQFKIDNDTMSASSPNKNQSDEDHNDRHHPNNNTTPQTNARRPRSIHPEYQDLEHLLQTLTPFNPNRNNASTRRGNRSNPRPRQQIRQLQARRQNARISALRQKMQNLRNNNMKSARNSDGKRHASAAPMAHTPVPQTQHNYPTSTDILQQTMDTQTVMVHHHPYSKACIGKQECASYSEHQIHKNQLLRHLHTEIQHMRNSNGDYSKFRLHAVHKSGQQYQLNLNLTPEYYVRQRVTLTHIYLTRINPPQWVRKPTKMTENLTISTTPRRFAHNQRLPNPNFNPTRPEYTPNITGSQPASRVPTAAATPLRYHDETVSFGEHVPHAYATPINNNEGRNTYNMQTIPTVLTTPTPTINNAHDAMAAARSLTLHGMTTPMMTPSTALTEVESTPQKDNNASPTVSFELKSDAGTLGLPSKPARLRHPDDDVVARFRKRFKDYNNEIDDFNESHGTNLTASMRTLVDESVRKQISRRYLHRHHKTGRREKINEREVQNYILREGEYANAGRDKPFVRDPIKALKDLKWGTKEKTLERRLAGYMTKFDEVVDELGDTEIDEKTFATIMLAAVTPTSLQEKIKDRMLTARPPDGDDENKATWRKHAKKNSNLMYDLIRENAQYEDKQRIMQAKTTSTPNLSNEICRNYKRGACKLGDKCPRRHVKPNNSNNGTNGTPTNNKPTTRVTKDENEEDTRND